LHFPTYLAHPREDTFLKPEVIKARRASLEMLSNFSHFVVRKLPVKIFIEFFGGFFAVNHCQRVP
jgi:hypothetical protein